ncbi:hypothetical protein DB347_13580 [Opitutaceae bacterium EW11]|nr:hypothetical protein DB347_13580 [Opitutaceae bacterium EW11]
MSFSCPHFDIDRDACLRLKTDCIPGRLGCVLRDNSVFSVAAEERVAQRKEEQARPDSPLLDGARRKPPSA